MGNGDLFFSIDSLINGAFDDGGKQSLRDLFEKRLVELDVTSTQALDVIGINYRSLNVILDGSKTTADYINIMKIADFLGIDRNLAVKLYIKSLELNHQFNLNVPTNVIEFIKENFDVAALKKAGFISSINDYSEIEVKLKDLYGLRSIFEYTKPNMDIAFSAGLIAPKNDLARSNWIVLAKNTFEDIRNEYEYDRKKLIEYFPRIRWHSTNVENGLSNVIRDLYRIGVTVIYQDPLPGVKLRGATFCIDEKPCIVLTDYAGFYPTLWFTLIHELFHVLFDWDEIFTGGYHISDDGIDILTVDEKEKEANNFAREYLFSAEKTNKASGFMGSEPHIKKFAEMNHVHESFFYLFYAMDKAQSGGHTWAKVHKHNPDFSMLISKLRNPWDNRISNSEFIKYLKNHLYA